MFRREFETIVDGLSDALDFSRTIGADAGSHPYERGGGRGTLGEVDFYTRSASIFNFLPAISYSHLRPLQLLTICALF